MTRDPVEELDEQEREDAGRLLTVAVGLSGFGVLAAGPAGLSFLVEPLCAPVWFTLAAVVMPTGESLALVRGFIRKRRPDT
jgi:hypothetical protein